MRMFKKPVQQVRSENLPTPHTSHKGSGRGCPLLRASNEHILIVRVLRARRAPGRSPSFSFDRPTSSWLWFRHSTQLWRWHPMFSSHHHISKRS